MLRTIFGSPKIYCREKCWNTTHCLFVGKLDHKVSYCTGNAQSRKLNVAWESSLSILYFGQELCHRSIIPHKQQSCNGSMETLSQYAIILTDLCRGRIISLSFLNSFLSSILQCMRPLPSAKDFFFSAFCFSKTSPTLPTSSSPPFLTLFPFNLCIRG